MSVTSVESERVASAIVVVPVVAVESATSVTSVATVGSLVRVVVPVVSVGPVVSTVSIASVGEGDMTVVSGKKRVILYKKKNAVKTQTSLAPLS